MMWDFLVGWFAIVGVVAVAVLVIVFYWTLWQIAKLYMETGDGRVKAIARAYWLMFVGLWSDDKSEEKWRLLAESLGIQEDEASVETVSMPEIIHETRDDL